MRDPADPVINDDLGAIVAEAERVPTIAELSAMRSYGLRRFAGDPRTGFLEAACRKRFRELTGLPTPERDGPPPAG